MQIRGLRNLHVNCGDMLHLLVLMPINVKNFGIIIKKL